MQSIKNNDQILLEHGTTLTSSRLVMDCTMASEGLVSDGGFYYLLY